MPFISLYVITLPIALAIDFLWIGIIAIGFYREQLGALMLPQVNLAPAILFYLLFAAALVFFVIAPALERQSLMYAIGAGAFLGLSAYAAYDLTNLATLVNWPLRMSIVDMAWGAVMAASTSGIVYTIATRWLA